MSDGAHRLGWFGKAWVVGVFGYSVLRSLVVWPTLSEYGVNPWLFLMIDLSTAWPYAYGQVRIVKAIRRGDTRSIQIWSVVALLAFLAPYAYIAGAGSGELPVLAWAVIGSLVVVFGAASIMRIKRQVREPESAGEIR